MTALEVFDRPLCCSTGICGPSVDPALVHFAADLDWLKSRGISVRRYNLAHEPAAFASQSDVREALQRSDAAALPLTRVGGRIVLEGAYPTREQLAAWCGLSAAVLPLAATGCCSGSGCCG